MQDEKTCSTVNSGFMSFIVQNGQEKESQQPQNVRTGGLGDLVFNKVLKDFF